MSDIFSRIESLQESVLEALRSDIIKVDGVCRVTKLSRWRVDSIRAGEKEMTVRDVCLLGRALGVREAAE